MSCACTVLPDTLYEFTQSQMQSSPQPVSACAAGTYMGGAASSAQCTGYCDGAGAMCKAGSDPKVQSARDNTGAKLCALTLSWKGPHCCCSAERKVQRMWCRANVTADSFTNKEGALVKDFPRAKIAVPVLGIMSKDEFLLTDQMEGSGRFIEPPGSWR